MIDDRRKCLPADITSAPLDNFVHLQPPGVKLDSRANYCAWMRSKRGLEGQQANERRDEKQQAGFQHLSRGRRRPAAVFERPREKQT